MTKQQEALYTNRVPRPAMAMWHYLRALGRLNGWIKIKVATLMRKFGRKKRCILGWLASLKAEGFLSSERHGRQCRTYQVFAPQEPKNAPQKCTSETAAPLLTELRSEKEQRETPRKGPVMETRPWPQRLQNLDRFEEFIGIFVAAGKPMNIGDVGAAKIPWSLLGPDEKAVAIAAIEKQLRATESAAFMPLPLSFLRAKPWTRTAPPRTLPYDKPSKILDRLEKAWQYLKDEGVA